MYYVRVLYTWWINMLSVKRVLDTSKSCLKAKMGIVGFLILKYNILIQMFKKRKKVAQIIYLVINL